ncbi:hypothetical protein CGLO_13801 [Colletotrichum gloeosporioides Cg-14]|uniref:Uncharacterized protein n=1 Tax=Colletotrichum gloeosporioides (strain Cg-14) TaxID=1237896 RepID=T0JVQ7_COLGC|nr:hypothetical protein CGLO_13801 [Colletotrichum gloeosporioides Cg-14]
MSAHCSTAGDGDLYGLGVRLGLYFQWAAGFLLRNFNTSWQTISTVRIVNNTIGFTIVLSTMINTARNISLTVDFLIVYYLTIALFYNESYNLLIKEDSLGKPTYVLRPDMPLLLQNLLFTVASLFGGWFWISGVTKAVPPTCAAKGAVIVSFDLNNRHWKAFAATMSIIAGAIFSCIFFIHLCYYSRKEVTRKSVVRAARIVKSGSGGTGPPRLIRPKDSRTVAAQRRLRPRLSPGTSIPYFVVNLAGPIIALSSVEMMIRRNHLVTDGVFESTGQMIALMAGTSSLCTAIWQLMSPISTRSLVSRLVHDSAISLSADDWRRISSQISDLISEAHEVDQDRKLIRVEH